MSQSRALIWLDSWLHNHIPLHVISDSGKRNQWSHAMGLVSPSCNFIIISLIQPAKLQEGKVKL